MIDSYEIISQPKNNLNPISSALTTANQTQISTSGDISNFTIQLPVLPLQLRLEICFLRTW